MLQMPLPLRTIMRTVKDPHVRRAEIVQAAQELFLKDPTMTLQDVMTALGIAKGTIYHYFKSKDELLEAAMEDLVNRHFEKMQLVVKKAKGNALEKMEVLIKASKIAAPALLDHLHQNEALHTRLLVLALMKQAPLYAEVIAHGCREGLFHTKTPLECAEFILSAVQFLTDRGIHSWTYEDLKRRKIAFPQLIEQMLGAPPESFKFLAKL